LQGETYKDYPNTKLCDGIGGKRSEMKKDLRNREEIQASRRLEEQLSQGLGTGLRPLACVVVDSGKRAVERSEFSFEYPIVSLTPDSKADEDEEGLDPFAMS
jgi:hypothetical protein